MVPILDSDAVLTAVSPAAAVELVTEAFERHGRGEWEMPAKLYLDAGEESRHDGGPAGDFRAMPARGDGLAMLKWVTSFPGNPARGLPVVTGALLVSSAATGELLAVVDCASVTSLRTGAAAAASARVLARADARSVGIIGSGVNGGWAARCLAAVGYGPGVCADARPEAAEALAGELGWSAGSREEAAAQDVVVTVTPGDEPVLLTPDLRPGQHLAVLGADSHGKAEVEREALRRCQETAEGGRPLTCSTAEGGRPLMCSTAEGGRPLMRLFCDEWMQASGGGELSGAVAAGEVAREDVTEIGAVIAGRAEGRRDPAEITLFDSTGLAIQDLAIARAVLAAWRSGDVPAPEVEL